MRSKLESPVFRDQEEEDVSPARAKVACQIYRTFVESEPGLNTGKIERPRPREVWT
jgi:hypothetical protein